MIGDGFDHWTAKAWEMGAGMWWLKVLMELGQKQVYKHFQYGEHDPLKLVLRHFASRPGFWSWDG